MPFGLSPEFVTIGHFIITWIVSGIVLWISAKLLDSKAGLVDAIIASLFGAIIFALFGFFGGRLLFTLLAVLVWLYMLKTIFDVGWLRAFVIAIVAWILAAVVWILFGIPVVF